MRDGLTADGIVLIFQGNDNTGGLVEILGGGVPREEKVPDEEHKVYKRPELDHPAVAGALCVVTGTGAEVEANGDQVKDVVGYEVGGAICRGDDEVHESQRGGLFSSDRGVLKPAGLELPCEALFEPGLCLKVGLFSWIWQTIQEVGRFNLPPCLRN